MRILFNKESIFNNKKQHIFVMKISELKVNKDKGHPIPVQAQFCHCLQKKSKQTKGSNPNID